MNMTPDIDFVLRVNIMNVLIECRKAKGLTQEQLANKIGSKKTTVASWEQGKSLPDLTTLYALSKFYSIRLEDFFEGKSIKNEGGVSNGTV